MAAAPVFLGSPKLGAAQIVNADGTNWKDIFSAGGNGSKIVSLMCAGDDTAIRNVQVSLLRGGTNYVLGTSAIPVASGTDGATPAVDLLNALQAPGLPVDNDNQHYLLLENGDKIQAKVLVAVTAAKTLSIVAQGGSF